jgi:hypothetical protein
MLVEEALAAGSRILAYAVIPRDESTNISSRNYCPEA